MQESYMMVPDSKGRLEKSILALSELIVSGIIVCVSVIDFLQEEVGEEVTDAAQLQEARTIVEESGINNS